jgi:uncharacterized protein YjiS (DUF1127 family)
LSTTTFASVATSGASWAGLRARWTESLARRRKYKATLNELREMTDRDLADIGLHRALIQEVAREAAYGS